MLETPLYNLRFSEDEYPYAEFGIIGGFMGDEDLEREIEWCKEAFQLDEKPSLSRLVHLLNELPLKGRLAIAKKVIGKEDRHRDEILKELFEYCFDSEDDDGSMKTEGEETKEDEESFVMIINPTAVDVPKPLNLNRHHIFQIVIILVAISKETGIELSRRYLQSASSRYRAKILGQCATTFSSKYFSDDELWQAYSDSPKSVQRNVVENCKSGGCRLAFLQRVYEDDPSHNSNLIYWLGSDYLASQLEKTDNKNFVFKRWGAHGNVYIIYIRARMEVVKKDCLSQGEIWSDMERRIELNSMNSFHVHELIKIYKLTNPCKLERSCPYEVQQHLKNLSLNGEDLSRYEQVYRLSFPLRILKKIKKSEKLELIMRAFRDSDWNAFQHLKPLVAEHKIPHTEVFSKAISKDLWTTIAGKPCSNAFFADSSNISYAKIPTPYERINIIKYWAELQLRCKPTDLSEEQRVEYSERYGLDLWPVWIQSYYRYLDSSYAIHVSSIIRKNADVKIVFSSKLAFYAQHLKELLVLLVQGMQSFFNANSKYINQLAPDNYFLRFLLACSYNDLEKRLNIEQVCELSKQIEGIITNFVIPELRKCICFDRSDQSTYISKSTIKSFKSICSSIIQSWGDSEKVSRKIALLLLDVTTRATKEHEMLDTKTPKFLKHPINNSSKFRIIQVDKSISRCAIEECLSCMKALLHRIKVRGLNFKFCKDIWAEVKKVKEGDYLQKCLEYLPGSLLEAEKPQMIKSAQLHLQSQYQEHQFLWLNRNSSFVTNLCRLRILETVAIGAIIPEKVRDTLLEDYGSFSNDIARQALRNTTFESDGATRAAGIVTWLEKAFATKCLSQIANALSFAASRVKNEQGQNRQIVFSWLKNSFVPQVVSLSFDNETANFKLLEKLRSKLILMQENDLKRLDSIGKTVCFPQLPRLILEFIIRYDPTKLQIKVRQLWADCAICLDWHLKQAVNGEDSLALYKFPAISPNLLCSANWIHPKAFIDAFPLDKVGNPEKISKLQLRGLLSDKYIHENFDKDCVFGPTHCVKLLVHALEEVWNTEFLSHPLHIEHIFEEDDGLLGALHRRIKFMIDLCGTAWQEVEMLTLIFDKVFLNIETSSEDKFKEAHKLLVHLIKNTHKDGGYQVPRIAKACDKLFRHAVRRYGEWDIADQLIMLTDCWMELNLLHDNRRWSYLSDDRFLHFVFKQDKFVELQPTSCRKTLKMNDTNLRMCTMARELLNISTSALVIRKLQDIIFTLREDIFLRYTQNQECLKGPFNFYEEYTGNEYKSGEYIPTDCLLHNCINDVSSGSKPLDGYSANICRRYSDVAMKNVNSSRKNLLSKKTAIQEFMSTPTTQHSDVLLALQIDLEDVVREKLIHNIFSLDSPWHTLDHLLSQSAIEKNDQRVTSALLDHVTKHINVNKVVRLLRVLLRNPRRKKLGLQLHKGIIRMLFDAKINDAINLLLQEWGNDLPISVRNLMVEKCMDSALVGNIEGWESSILIEVASDKTAFDLETKFYLFSPAVNELVIPEADECEQDEVLMQFTEKAPQSIALTVEMADFFYSIFEKLEEASNHATLGVLARCKRFSIANLFLKERRSDDQGVLDEMSKVLTSYLSWNHQTQLLLSVVSTLFAHGTIHLLNHRLAEEEINYRSSDKLVMAALSSQSNVISRFRNCIGARLKELLDLPIRDIIRRQQLLTSLKESLKGVTDFSCTSILPKILVHEPFKSELDLLRKDLRMVQQLDL